MDEKDLCHQVSSFNVLAPYAAKPNQLCLSCVAVNFSAYLEPTSLVNSKHAGAQIRVPDEISNGSENSNESVPLTVTDLSSDDLPVQVNGENTEVQPSVLPVNTYVETNNASETPAFEDENGLDFINATLKAAGLRLQIAGLSLCGLMSVHC